MEASIDHNPQPAIPNPSKGDEKAPGNQIPPRQVPKTNEGTEPELNLSAEEVRGVLHVIASTGKFWNDWDELKNMLSFQLKQVLSEYLEANMADDPVNSSLGETYEDLFKRLDEAIHSFIEGPPYTLQRLCL